MNQCNGRGTCYLGFCRCDEGWYGHDCALQRAAAKSSDDPGAGWLKHKKTTSTKPLEAASDLFKPVLLLSGYPCLFVGARVVAGLRRCQPG